MHALDIPEIQTHVGHYLNKRDLGSCSLVCRDWNTTFIPLLWHSLAVQVDEPVSFGSNTTATPELRLYGHHVQDLHLTIRMRCWDAKSFLAFNNLQRLTLVCGFGCVRDGTSQEHEGHWDAIQDLLRANKGLKSLDLLCMFRTCDPPFAFWKTVQEECQGLKRLAVDGCRPCKGMDRVGVECFLKICGRLESLKAMFRVLALFEDELAPDTYDFGAVITGNSNQDDSESINFTTLTAAPFQHLKEAEIVHCWLWEILLLRNSCGPSLERLTFGSESCPEFDPLDIYPSMVMEAITQRPLSSLRDLIVSAQTRFNDKELSKIIQSLVAPLDRLFMSRTCFGQETFAQLCYPLQGRICQLDRLRVLLLWSCDGCTSEMAQYILSHGRHLEEFTARVLFEEDVAEAQERNEGRPTWVCVGMRVLAVLIHGTRMESDLVADSSRWPRESVLGKEVAQLTRLDRSKSRFR